MDKLKYWMWCKLGVLGSGRLWVLESSHCKFLKILHIFITIGLQDPRTSRPENPEKFHTLMDYITNQIKKKIILYYIGKFPFKFKGNINYISKECSN